MRIRVAYTVDVTDDRRRAINQFYGRPGLATRGEVMAWYQSNGDSMDLDLDASLDIEGSDDDVTR